MVFVCISLRCAALVAAKSQPLAGTPSTAYFLATEVQGCSEVCGKASACGPPTATPVKTRCTDSDNTFVKDKFQMTQINTNNTEMGSGDNVPTASPPLPASRVCCKLCTFFHLSVCAQTEKHFVHCGSAACASSVLHCVLGHGYKCTDYMRPNGCLSPNE